MEDRRAAEVKLPRTLHDQDEDINYRRPNRSRVDDSRPPAETRSYDDADAMQSSPGRSHHGHSRDYVPMTYQTDNDPYEDEDEDDDDGEFNVYRVQGTIREWVTRDDVRLVIADQFKKFLHRCSNPEDDQQDDGPEYIRLINKMVSANKFSLEIDYVQFLKFEYIIGIWLAEAPQSVLEIMEDVAKNVVLDLYPKYMNSHHQKIYVRIANFIIYEQISNLRQINLNTLIRIRGVVMQESEVFPQLLQVNYDCSKCGMVLGPFLQNSCSQVKVGSCPECQSKGTFTVNIVQTIYRNYKKITLQESPRIVPAGQLRKYMEVILLNDLNGCGSTGEEIEVTGVYTTNNFDLSLNTKTGFRVFATMVEANYVTNDHRLFYQEDEQEIVKLAKDPRIGERIVKSIAPSIYGHEDIKTAIALAMFGAEEKNVEWIPHRLRGDINVLLLGDPDTAKSQFLKYVEKTGRDIYLIDDFDKMNDKVSIHEAEHQSISISEAETVTSFTGDCSVIAAASPIGGRYDSSKDFSQNVELTDPIIYRFDILCVLKDVEDPVVDEMLAEFVVDSYFKSQAKGANIDDMSILSQDILKKYITYAKLNVFPILHDADLNKLKDVNAELHKESVHGQGVPIAPRHIESMIRMSEAHARMHLRQHVKQEDVNKAIQVLRHSLISTQNFKVQKALKKVPTPTWAPVI